VRVAILDDFHHAYDGTSGVARLRQHADVRIFTAPVTDLAALRGFDALVTNRERTRVTDAWLAQVPDVRIIAQTGNHAHHIDLAAAARRGVVVAKASGGFSHGAAELAIGLAIALMRRIPQADAAIRRGEWLMPSTRALHGKTLGIVGLGRVGRHVATLGGAFGMRVCAWSPRLSPSAAAAAGVERLALDDLLRQSDVVSIHAALTADSRRLIDAPRLALMRESAVLINTARAALVDEAALVTALRERRIAGAGLDVFEDEPLPAAHPLTMLDNVVITPHIGWATDEGYERFAEAACDVLVAYQEGRDVPRFTS
jgi:phosphoglycerate dehydrogenase-like enzyme